MSWRIHVENAGAVKEMIARKQAALRQGALEVAQLSAVRFRGRIVTRIQNQFGFSKSRIPRPKTNRLSRGVRTYAEEMPSGVRVVGGVSSSVPYARIQEQGGQTRPHPIYPRRKKMLRWLRSEFVGPIQLTKSGKPTRGNAGAFVFARYVKEHPGSKIIGRPYMRPSALEERDAFVSDLTKKYDQVLKED